MVRSSISRSLNHVATVLQGLAVKRSSPVMSVSYCRWLPPKWTLAFCSRYAYRRMYRRRRERERDSSVLIRVFPSACAHARTETEAGASEQEPARVRAGKQFLEIGDTRMIRLESQISNFSSQFLARAFNSSAFKSSTTERLETRSAPVIAASSRNNCFLRETLTVTRYMLLLRSALLYPLSLSLSLSFSFSRRPREQLQIGACSYRS